MKKIYKYVLEVTGDQSIAMPDAAKVLAIQVQHGKPCVWAEVDSEQTVTAFRRFVTVGTGAPTPEDFDKLHYVGTYQLDSGNFVGHVYVDRL